MKSMNRFPYHLGAASSLVLAACGVLAQEADQYTPLALQNRPPLKTAWQANEPLIAQLGAGYTSDDNYMFGEYNGLNKEGRHGHRQPAVAGFQQRRQLLAGLPVQPGAGYPRG